MTDEAVRSTSKVKHRALASVVLTTAGMLWAVGVFAGLRVIWRYETIPGASGEPPAQWPADTRIPRVPGRSTLVMLAHPRCSCTRASLVELNAIMAEVDGAVAGYVLFVKPNELPEDWADTDTWTRAQQIPNVTALRDAGGEEARRFHAETSGQTLVYDPAGRLIFNGGITGARGHQGDNAGRRRVVSLLTTGEADQRESPVFGCALNDSPVAELTPEGRNDQARAVE